MEMSYLTMLVSEAYDLICHEARVPCTKNAERGMMDSLMQYRI